MVNRRGQEAGVDSMANIIVRRKSGFIRRSGGMRRQSVWIPITPTDTTLAAASTAVLFAGLSTAALALRPFTIVRTRGIFWVRSDQLGASEDYMASLGAAVVSDQALAIGVTAVPTPETDRGSDLFFLYESAAQGITIFSSVGHSGFEGNFLQFDSRAMRKVNEDEDVAMSIETAPISAGAQVLKAGRMLLKLH